MNKINFANPELLTRTQQRNGIVPATLWLCVCMCIIQAIAIGYWYTNNHTRMPVNQKHAATKTLTTQIQTQQAQLDALAPFLNAPKKTTLSALHKHAMHPQIITINEQGIRVQIALKTSQPLNSAIQKIQLILQCPMAIQSIQENENLRYVNLIAESQPQKTGSRQGI